MVVWLVRWCGAGEEGVDGGRMTEITFYGGGGCRGELEGWRLVRQGMEGKEDSDGGGGRT